MQDLWARCYLASSEPVVQMIHKVVEEQRAAQPKGTQSAQQVSPSADARNTEANLPANKHVQHKQPYG